MHAGLRRRLLKYPGGKAPGGCIHVGGEHVGGKSDVVDDGWDVGMEREVWMDGDRAVRERV